MTLMVHPSTTKDPTVNERVSPEAKKYYDERFVYWLEQGEDPGTAADNADMDLLQWSMPIPLPKNMDLEEMWT